MLWRDETAAVVAGLGPWVGIQQKGAVNGRIGKHFKHIAHITRMDCKIIDTCAPDLSAA